MNKGIFSLVTIISLMACSQQIYHTINWQINPVMVDGISKEWKIPLKNYDSSLKLNYEFSNDNKNLYFAARTSDQSTIQQIMHDGLSIELDTVYGDNSYPFSIKYPVMQGPPQMEPQNGQNSLQLGAGKPNMNTNQNSTDTNKMPQDFQSGQNNNFFQIPAKEIMLFGFNGIEEDSVTVPFSKTNGIFAQYSTDSEGILFYEIVIPFNTFFKPEISANDTTTIFSCRLTVESMGGAGMPAQDSQGGMGGPPPGSGMSGGPGGPPPGSMNGGPGGGPGMGDGPQMNNSSTGKSRHTIKLNFSLSYQE